MVSGCGSRGVDKPRRRSGFDAAAICLNYPVTETFGDLQRDVWTGLQPLYRKLGLIDAEIDPASFLDCSLVAAANDFTDAEIQAALAGKPFGRP